MYTRELMFSQFLVLSLLQDRTYFHGATGNKNRNFGEIYVFINKYKFTAHGNAVLKIKS